MRDDGGMNDAAVDRHIETLRSMSRDGGPLAAGSARASVRNREWFTQAGRPTPERRRLHRALLEEAWGQFPQAEQGRRALVLAGPPGAGKSSIRKAVLGAENDAYVTVNSDNFKVKLMKQAERDGSFESFFKGPELRALEATGERLFPMELASLVHEESSMLARQFRNQVLDSGMNIVVDGVLAGQRSAVGLGEQLQAAGFEIAVVDVEVPFEVSEQAIRVRWQGAHERAVAGEETLGGRWVPSEFARDVFDGPDQRSRPEAVAADLARTNPNVLAYQVWRRQGAVEPATCDVDMRRASFGSPLVDLRSAQALAADPEALEATRVAMGGRVEPLVEQLRAGRGDGLFSGRAAASTRQRDEGLER